MVVWLAQHARPGRRPADLALQAFGAGLPVPEQAVRSAFGQAVDRIQLRPEQLMPAAGADQIADAAVALGLLGTFVPRRVRRIDQQLAQLGLPWAPAELAALDHGPASSPVTPADFTHSAVQAVLDGGDQLDLATMGAIARAMMPAGAAAPIASQLERAFPDNEVEAEYLINEDGGLAVLPSGDLRAQLRALALSTPWDALVEAWSLAARLPRWACDLCDAVTAEIATGQIGEATKEWWIGAYGLPRQLLIMALRDSKARPHDIALTALTLLWIQNMIKSLHELMPHGQFDLLSHPMVMPALLVPFINRAVST